MAKRLDGWPGFDMAEIPSLVETLRRVHEGRAEADQKPAPAAETSLRGALRAGVEWMEREARRHAEFVDRLTQTPAPAKTAPYQQTLYLQGPCGGRTGGRFRCLNRREAEVEVGARLRPFSLGGAPVATAPALTLKPAGFLLKPGEARLVEVAADLADCADPGRYESSVDILMNEAVALKLWIEIDVYR